MNVRRFHSLKEQGFTPSVIVDGGAHFGQWTHFARDIYPDSSTTRILSIEANADCAEIIRRNNPDSGIEVVIALLGDKDGPLATYYAQNDLYNSTGNSIFLEQSANFADGCMHAVQLPMKTLDTVLAERGIRKVDMIKLDVQGAERIILEGAKQTLASGVDVILLEVSVLSYNEGAPTFAEMITYMDSLGYVLYDIWDINYYNGQHLFQIDMVFVPQGSPYIYQLKR